MCNKQNDDKDIDECASTLLLLTCGNPSARRLNKGLQCSKYQHLDSAVHGHTHLQTGQIIVTSQRPCLGLDP